MLKLTKIFVSILVLLEVGREGQTINIEKDLSNRVSILVLLEVGREAGREVIFYKKVS